MSDELQQANWNISVSPHIRDRDSVSSIMLTVVISLIPALAASIYFFGRQAAMLVSVCVISCLAIEWLVTKFLLRKPNTLTDFSALVTALLLAFNLPPSLPWWMAVIGSLVAIGIAKLAFGGLGNNFINPALAGRAFLMAAYPASMTTWTAPLKGTMSGLSNAVDAISQATPLAAFSAAVKSGSFQALDFQEAIFNLFIGNRGGCLGETSVIALLAGAMILLYRRVIGFSIPVFYIATVFILFWIFNGTGGYVTSDALIVPFYQILSGGLMLGAWFMATDMVTSPITRTGKIIFGAGCGILTFVIRKYGGYPEGVSYSILLMNLVAPHIDRFTRPRIYGKVKKRA
jgi:electron transport complex protein RnfD